MYLSILIAGFGGGVIRGLVGFIKHQYSYKNVSFKLPYFLAMTFISGVIGLLTAIVIKELGITFLGLTQLTPALAFVVGYAGGDFLENVYPHTKFRYNISRVCSMSTHPPITY